MSGSTGWKIAYADRTSAIFKAPAEFFFGLISDQL
jgi:hypothetical protein